MPLPPFQFEQYRPQNDQAITDLIRAQAQSRANALRTSGDAQAQAAIAGGNSAAQIGMSLASLAGIPLQAQQLKQQQRTLDQTNELRDIQLGEAKRDARGNQMEAAILPMALKRGDNGLTTFDRDLLTREFTAAGIADRLPKIIQGLDAADAATLQVNAAKRDAFAGLAYGVMESGNDPASFNYALQYAKENGLATDREISELIAQVGDDPNKIAQVTRGIVGKSKPWADLVQTGQYQRATTAVALTNAERQVKAQEETARHNEALERIGLMTAGRAEAQAAEQARHNRIMENVAQQNATTASRRAGSLFGDEVPDDIETAASRATLSLPASRRAPIVETINRLAKEGKLQDVKEVIMQAAVEGENVDQKNLIAGRRAVLAALKDTREKLNELKAKGVPTGWLTGNLEDLARRLGKTTNPEYVRLANGLMDSLITYRRSATGAAFGERESADYAKMFSNYKNELPVNLALIDGLERSMKAYDRTYWENKLGKEGAALVGAIVAENKGGSIAEGTQGTVNGQPAVWRNGEKGMGWYAR